MTLAQYRVLILLCSLGPRRIVDLAEALAVSQPNATRLCARLSDPTEQLVLKRVFLDGQTQRKVAEELHVSQMQSSRLVANALAKMKQSFQPA